MNGPMAHKQVRPPDKKPIGGMPYSTAKPVPQDTWKSPTERLLYFKAIEELLHRCDQIKMGKDKEQRDVRAEAQGVLAQIQEILHSTEVDHIGFLAAIEGVKKVCEGLKQDADHKEQRAKHCAVLAANAKIVVETC